MDDSAQARPKDEAYSIFCGAIDQQVVARIFRNLVDVTHTVENIGHLHVLFQSTGGTVGDCVCLHNLFRAFPLDLTLYNVGAIQSGAVTSYLGAKRRQTSAHAQFMLHRSHCSAQFASLSRLESTAHSLRMDDARTEAIVRAHTTLPDEMWIRMRESDVFLSGIEAVTYGLADEIGEFAPPPGSRLYLL
jgi:ATP-dependent Clp protease protease subunit